MNYILDLLGLNNLSFNEFLWVSFGTLGQLIFFSRWIIQWFYSEKSKISTIPLAFWWCSLLVVITLVTIYRELPFMLAQAIGIIVYSRNLLLIYRKKKNETNSKLY